MSLLADIENRSARVRVLGLGYVGLSVALDAEKAGFPVVGVDVDVRRVESLRQGRSYLEYLPDSRVAEALASGRFQASQDFSALSGGQVYLICVPTPLDAAEDPDLSYVCGAAQQVARHLGPDQLVTLESTTYPGTTEEVLRPILESSGLGAGRDFWLAFSPERIDPGNSRWNLRNTPKVVGGLTAGCARAAATFYRALVDQVIEVDSTRTAEMVKLYENTFRNINIAFANEMALLCDRMGLNIWKVIEAASTKPYGFMPFYPGPGPGGHCIPVDPRYLAWKAGQYGFELRFVELASRINAEMPAHICRKASEALSRLGKRMEGAQMLVMGVSYKRDIGDLREAPALKVISLLQQQGAQVSYHDPYVPQLDGIPSVDISDGSLARADCVLLITDHSCFDYQRLLETAHLVVDARNAIPAPAGPRLVKL